MKKLLILSITLLILGAGCSQTNESTTQTNDQQTSKPATNTIQTNTSTITLIGEAVGNQTVKLEWQVTEGLMKEATAYGLVLDNETNPIYPGRYWYQRGPAHFKLDWTNLPIGKSHIRACVMQQGKCTVYSNDIEVDIN